MKILFINLPYHGHVIPTIGLTQELIQAGHQVTYLMPYDWKERIADSGADFLGYENHPKLDKQIRNAFIKAEEVIAAHDLVLYEQFFFVGKHLAEKHGKPCVRVFTAPATNKQLMRQFISSGANTLCHVKLSSFVMVAHHVRNILNREFLFCFHI